MYYEALAAQLFEKVVFFEHDHPIMIDSSVRGETFALACIKKRGGSAFSKDISKDMGVSSARTAAIVNNMVSKGYVERVPCESDGRKTEVRLLPLGEEHFEKLKKKVISLAVSLLRALGPDDAQEYVRLQLKLSDIIREKRSD